jgi:hypothetical protein
MRLLPPPAEPPGTGINPVRFVVDPALAVVLLYVRMASAAEVAVFPTFQPYRIAAAVVMLISELDEEALKTNAL